MTLTAFTLYVYFFSSMTSHVYYTCQPVAYFFSIHFVPYLLLRILLIKIHMAHRFLLKPNEPYILITLPA